MGFADVGRHADSALLHFPEVNGTHHSFFWGGGNILLFFCWGWGNETSWLELPRDSPALRPAWPCVRPGLSQKHLLRGQPRARWTHKGTIVLW